MANQLTVFWDVDGALAARIPEVGNNSIAGSALNSGCNIPASNSPGIGIATAGNLATQNLNESDPQWTLLDQNEDPRTPQVGQYIGGSGLGNGTEGKGTVGIIVSGNATNANLSGQGFIGPSPVSEAHLIDLATGWEPVVKP